MSANNFISILRKKTTDKPDTFIVQELDADSGGLITDIGKFYDLENAVKSANKYQDENEVEYGLDIRV